MRVSWSHGRRVSYRRLRPGPILPHGSGGLWRSRARACSPRSWYYPDAHGPVFIDRTGTPVPKPRFDTTASGFPPSGTIPFTALPTVVWLRRDGTEIRSGNERCWLAARSERPLDLPLLEAFGCGAEELAQVPPEPPPPLERRSNRSWSID